MSTGGTLEFKGAIRLILDPAPPPEGWTEITTRYEGFVSTVKGDRMSYQLPNDHLVVVQVAYKDAKGNPAKVDSVAWSASDPAVVTVAEDPQDPTICTITPLGPATDVQVTATADVDLGDGVKNLTTLLDVTVLAGEAVTGTIAPMGPAEPIAPHPEQERGRRK